MYTELPNLSVKTEEGVTLAHHDTQAAGRPVVQQSTPRVKMSNNPIEFHVLGPTEARQGGRAIPLSGARRRALVTRLLLDAGRAVSADTLLEDVWGEHLRRRWRRCRVTSPSFEKS
jgi:DNA-binding response OmpR family regulator